jgi:AcrR family transcriptional regulator
VLQAERSDLVPEAKRPDPRAERAHAAVIQAAVDIFLGEGVAALTVEAVAARSGVAKTTIYRRWANRDELLLEVFGQFSLGIELPPLDLPAQERVRQVVRGMASALATPVWRRALPALLSASTHRHELAAVHDRIEAHQARVVSTVVGDAIAAGALPPDTDRSEAVMVLLGPLLMAALMQPDLLNAQFADRLADRLFLAAPLLVPPAIADV